MTALAHSGPATDRAPSQDIAGLSPAAVAALMHLIRSGGASRVLEWTIDADRPAVAPALGVLGSRVRSVRGPALPSLDPNAAFDLILVRGAPASDALARVPALLAPAGQLILIGPPTPAADAAKAALCPHMHIGPGPSGEHMWVGGHAVLTDAGADDAPPPIVANFYTKNTPYEQEAARLAESCRAHGLELISEGLTTRGRWEFNCAIKPRFVRDVWKRFNGRRAVVWLDADAVVRAPIPLLTSRIADFAAHRVDHWQIWSGTLLFGPGEATGRLLDRWCTHAELDPQQWDQVHLSHAWEDVAMTMPLRTRCLPQSYLRVFDHPMTDPTGAAPVIEHLQASYRFKAAAGQRPARAVVRGHYPLTTPHLRAARPPTTDELNVIDRPFEHLTDLASLLAETRARRVLVIAPDRADASAAIRALLPPDADVQTASDVATVEQDAPVDVLVCWLPRTAGPADIARTIEIGLARAGLALAVLVETAPLGTPTDGLAIRALAAAHAPHYRCTYATPLGRPLEMFVWSRTRLARLPVVGAVAPDAASSPEAAENTSSSPSPTIAASATPAPDVSAALDDLGRRLRAALAHADHLSRTLMRGKLEHAAALGCARIAIYGAGRHTRRVLDGWSNWPAPLTPDGTPARPVVILDDAPTTPALHGVPVVRPDDCPRDIDAVIISSDAHEAALARAATTRFGPRGVPVLTLYAGAQLNVAALGQPGEA